MKYCFDLKQNKKKEIGNTLHLLATLILYGVFVYTQCLECRQIYVQIYIAICRRGRGLGLRKSTVFYMDLPAL